MRERYGNLFDIYHEITNENAYQVPMRIFPAVHYTMGGLWVDYNLMSNVPGLFVLGEANFSDHGANRLGASALMQGLADGYFVLPYTIGDYLAAAEAGLAADGRTPRSSGRPRTNVRRRPGGSSPSRARSPSSHFHKRLGHILWQHCGMARNRAGLEKALREIPALREEFWANVNVPGSGDSLNQSLERAARVADFLELGELMCRDALTREESCGGHFREEHQYPDGECKRDDEQLRPRGRLGVRGRGRAPPAQRRAARLRVGEDERAQLQVMNAKTFNVTLRVWRQPGPGQPGRFVDYPARGRQPRHVVPRDARRRERRADAEGRGADRVRARLPRGDLRHLLAHDRRQAARAEPRASPPARPTCAATGDGDLIVVEPFRARPFPVVKDLVTDRSAFDKIQQAGGFITARTGSAPEANAAPVPKDVADLAMDAAQCIGCGACVAACKNSSAMLFVAAKVSHLGLLPQGQPERDRRVLAMVTTMDGLGFGSCTNQYECSAACPKLISHDFIARMNRDYAKAVFRAAFSPRPADVGGE